jgi:hypothetical protein
MAADVVTVGTFAAPLGGESLYVTQTIAGSRESIASSEDATLHVTTLAQRIVELRKAAHSRPEFGHPAYASSISEGADGTYFAVGRDTLHNDPLYAYALRSPLPREDGDDSVVEVREIVLDPALTEHQKLQQAVGAALLRCLIKDVPPKYGLFIRLSDGGNRTRKLVQPYGLLGFSQVGQRNLGRGFYGTIRETQSRLAQET